jgi:hypothetical protein
MLCRTIIACTYAVLSREGSFGEWWELIAEEVTDE